MYEPYGFSENNEYMGKVTQLQNELATNRENDKKEFASVEYSETLKAFIFKNTRGEAVGMAEMKDIIPQDLIENAKYDVETKSIIITFTNGQEIKIPLDDIIDVAEAGDGLQLLDNKFSIKLHENCETFLNVDEGGLKLSGVQDAINVERDRAMSAETIENERAMRAENDIVNALSLETSTRKSEDKRIIEDILERIWTNKTQDSGETGNFQTTYDNGSGSYAQISNDPTGGGSRYFNAAAGILSSVGVNSDNANGVCAQVSSINNSSKVGARLNVNPNGIYYTSRKADSTFTADDEIITKRQEQALYAELESVNQALTIEINTLKSEINTLKAQNTSMNSEITSLKNRASSLETRVTALERRFI